MAILRGGTYVDGNLTVGGYLQVKTLKALDTSLPYLAGSALANHVVRFADAAGGIISSPIDIRTQADSVESIEGDTHVKDLSVTDATRIVMETYANNMYVINKDLIYDNQNDIWRYGE